MHDAELQGPFARLLDDMADMAAVRALENGVWLAFANRSGREHDYDFDGQSAIVGPDGVVRARALADEALLTAVLDAPAMDAARSETPYLADMRWSPPRL